MVCVCGPRVLPCNPVFQAWLAITLEEFPAPRDSHAVDARAFNAALILQTVFYDLDGKGVCSRLR